jgi:hypothetical protein
MKHISWEAKFSFVSIFYKRMNGSKEIYNFTNIHFTFYLTSENWDKISISPLFYSINEYSSHFWNECLRDNGINKLFPHRYSIPSH